MRVPSRLLLLLLHKAVRTRCGLVGEVSFVIVCFHNKSFKDVDGASCRRSPSLSDRRCFCQPCGLAIRVAFLLQLVNFFMGPATHCDRFTTMTYSLMRGFAFITNEGMKFDANRPKAKLFRLVTIWACRILFCQLAHSVFGRWRHLLLLCKRYFVNCLLIIVNKSISTARFCIGR